MLNPKTNLRELAYLVKIDKIEPIEGSDNCEAAYVGGWHIMVRKETFKTGDLAIYFEIDSHLDTNKPEFAFLEKKHGAIKTQKYTFGGKGNFVSQGLLMSTADFGWDVVEDSGKVIVIDKEGFSHNIEDDSRFLTEKLGVTYYVPEDNTRKSKPVDKITRLKQSNPNLFKKSFVKFLIKYEWGKKLIIYLFYKKGVNKKDWPDGKFAGVKRTDQERVENMPWVLNDKTPYIRTQKCDGSSGTFILSRKNKHKYEFYVCSRNVRMLSPNQESFYGEHNYYWEVALKYDIENKMKDYLEKNPDISFVCWQGEICAPNIQKNPQHLTETHLYCFHMTDSKNGRYDIREAKKIWESYNMEVVPIDEELYILPDTMEEFKLTADGVYDASVCEGDANCPREGYVYYKSTDPTFSFKNVSNQYLLNL